MVKDVNRSVRNSREKILDAAFETLRTRGYAGTSARTIAATGGFNHALVFYYYDSLTDLLVETLARSNAQRLERHRPRIERARSIEDLLRVLSRIYREDTKSGHVCVVSELVAASVAEPELAPRVLALMEPWIELAEEAVARVGAGSPLADAIPPRQLALVAITFYLGANLLTHLVPERAEVGALLRTATRLAPLLDSLAGS